VVMSVIAAAAGAAVVLFAWRLANVGLSLLVHKTAPRYPKAARELCRAAFTTNCRNGPVRVPEL
jgi:hypothetical protein